MIERHPIIDRQEWLNWRRFYLGASDVAAAVGLDEYRSPLALYAEKSGMTGGATENAAMKRGRLFEVAAVEYLREEKPDWKIVRPNLFLADPDLRLACTPDALVETAEHPDELVDCQIKIVSRPVFERWNGMPPIGYQLQVTAENLLLDAARGILAVLVVGTYEADLQLFDIPRHAAAEEKIRAIAREFWDNIATGRRPAPDYNRDGETIAALFPKPGPGKTIDLSADNRLAKILPEREFLKDRIDGDKKQVEAFDAEIKYKIGDAETAELPGWTLSLKEENRKEYTVPASTRRVLRVKQLKDKEMAA